MFQGCCYSTKCDDEQLYGYYTVTKDDKSSHLS